MKLSLLLASAFLATGWGQSFNCDLHEYKAMDGLKTEMRNGALEFSWTGARGQELRAGFTIRNGQPTVTEFAARKPRRRRAHHGAASRFRNGSTAVREP